MSVSRYLNLKNYEAYNITYNKYLTFLSSLYQRITQISFPKVFNTWAFSPLFYAGQADNLKFPVISKKRLLKIPQLLIIRTVKQ